MAAPIGPGDWIECVRAGPNLHTVCGVRVGGIYCVEAMQEMDVSCAACASCDRVGLRLVGQPIKVKGYRADWICGGGFRPIYRPNADLIESLKAPPITAPPIRQTQDA